MEANIAPEHAPPLGSHGDHLLPVGSQRDGVPHPWIMERGFAEIHDQRIPPRAWANRYDRIGEVLVQHVRLWPLQMAPNPRHGELAPAEGRKDLGEVSHDYRLIPIDVRETGLPV